MCWMAAIPVAMAGVQGATSALQSRAATAANNDALRKQAIQQVSQMNYTDANLKMQQADTADDLRLQKTQNNMQQIRNMGTLTAAIGESGMEGNTMKRLQQVTNGDYVKQAQGLNDNYERDYAKIFGDRVSNIENSKNSISTLKSKESKVKSVLATLAPTAIGSAVSLGMLAYDKGSSSSKKSDQSKASGSSSSSSTK